MITKEELLNDFEESCRFAKEWRDKVLSGEIKKEDVPDWRDDLHG